MPTSVIDHLRRTVLREAAGLGDAELLGRFLEGRDEAALAALVRRHGPMVWGVCRRLLGHHDAEDAFQATFLVLVKKAAAVVPRELVGNFLYGVAHQTALQARRTAARRRAREVQVTVMPEPEAVPPDQWPDVKPLLDQELGRLPDIYRTVVVLCDLEGRTRKEVARQLGVPPGTVAGRLARARALLAKRLTERGVTLSAGVLAAVLAQNVASAAVPNAVVSSTIQAARLLAAGRAAAGGAISGKVAALTEGVMKAMLFRKLRAALAVVLLLGFLATGAILLTCRTAAGQPDRKPSAEKAEKAEKPVEPAAKQEKEQEPFTAWGTEVDGLQAGLGYPPGAKRAYHHGETVTLVVRVRNVRKETVRFSYLQPFVEHWPTVTDSAGKRVPQPALLDEIGERLPGVVELPPGKEIELHALKRQLRPASESASKEFMQPYALYGTGKVEVQYEQVLGTPEMGYPGWKLDPTLSKLATGKLALEIKSAPPPPAGKDRPQKKDARDMNQRPIRIRVYINQVNEDTATIAASCMLIGEIDGVTKPVRLENLRVADKARITDRGKNLKLAELKSLPRDTHYYLFLNTYEEEFGFEVVGIETIRPDAAVEEDTAPKRGPPDAVKRPTKIRVVIEKVNLETATLTASCLLLGLTDNVTRPVRLENLQVALKAKITDRGKELTLEDLKALPRDTHFYLLLRVYEGEEFGFEVVGIDTIPPAGVPGGAPNKE
jgi:RNA polymerase sigma factor (sigma-70 family)